jgi:SAM-dependent methyltransferase
MKPYYDNVRSDVLGILPAAAFPRILEVGGGNFPTLLKLKEMHGAEAWGIDIHHNDNPGIRFIHGSVASDAVTRQVPDAYFSLVVANDVIEHLVETEKFFGFVAEKLESGGILALSVPNIRQIRVAYEILFRGTFPRRDAGLFDRTHLRWFCRKDVLDLAGSHGFTPLHVRSVGRLVPHLLERTRIAEFLALHNLFILGKQSA